MPYDRLLFPDSNEVIHSRDPVETAKRHMDAKDIKYMGQYMPGDDCYIITVVQKRPIPDGLFRLIKSLGFSNTGKKKFYYKRYSVVEQVEVRPQPIYGDGMFDSQPLHPAPDPFYNNYNV